MKTIRLGYGSKPTAAALLRLSERQGVSYQDVLAATAIARHCVRQLVTASLLWHEALIPLSMPSSFNIVVAKYVVLRVHVEQGVGYLALTMYRKKIEKTGPVADILRYASAYSRVLGTYHGVL